MKTTWTGYCLVWICLAPLLQGEPLAQLEAFSKKLETSTPSPQDQSDYRSNVMQALALIRLSLKQGDYEQARQSLRSFNGYRLPPEIQKEWAELTGSVLQQINELEEKATAQWQADVDQLVADTRVACLTATKPDNLDALLLRCAALQMKRSQRGSVWGERISYKLNGCVQTLEGWSKYLDFKVVNNPLAADTALRGLLGKSSQYPVVPEDEIRKRLINEAVTEGSYADILAKSFQGITSPDKLSVVRERLQPYRELNPMYGNAFDGAIDRAAALTAAWNCVEKNQLEEARKNLDHYIENVAGVDNSKYFKPLLQQVVTALLRKKAAAWIGLVAAPEENGQKMIDRLLTEMKNKQEYDKMLTAMVEIMPLAEFLDLPPLYGERGALEKFLAAKRFMAAKDEISAFSCYRQVVGSAKLRYVPQAEAEEEMKKLIEKNPELTKGGDPALMAEIQALRAQLQAIRSTPGRPF